LDWPWSHVFEQGPTKPQKNEPEGRQVGMLVEQDIIYRAQIWKDGVWIGNVGKTQ